MIADRYGLAILLPAWCQLRRGEVLGLQRRDVDLMHGTIRIERSVVKPMDGTTIVGSGRERTAGIARSRCPPMCCRSYRIILGVTSHRSREGLAVHQRERRTDDPRHAQSSVAKGPSQIGRTDLHYHDLRHTGLTWAAASGASVAELMRRGGHASPTAALRYQHATEDRDRAIADALAELATGRVVRFNASRSRTRRSR